MSEQEGVDLLEPDLEDLVELDKPWVVLVWNDLAKGDKISVVTGQGKHTYVVDRIRYTGDPIPTFSESGSFLTLVSASSHTSTSYSPYSIDFIDKDNCWGVFLGHLEEVTYA